MKIALNDNWRLYEAPLHWPKERLAQVLALPEGALPCSLPCDVRMPLIKAGVIGDPVEADNFRRSLWVEQRSWWFAREFQWPGGEFGAVELTLDRLDFGADIFINGVHIGRHESVHYPFTMDVREWLRAGENTLAVRLTCGLETVTDEGVAGAGIVFTEEGNGCPERGDRRRASIRKPQHVFGWDWCPRVATCGIGEASIAAYGTVAIRHVVFSTVALAGDCARVRVRAVVESLLPIATQQADVAVTLFDGETPAASAVQKGALLLSGWNWLDFELDVPGARLWWPNGYGGQPLYRLEARVAAQGGTAAHSAEVGIRTLELDTSPLAGGGRRFAFRVNGVAVQCKGGNWIPADSVYARITDGKYERLIAEAAQANFTMLRVWGGGLYEKDVFYRLCDRHGLLVWQDFMFGCAAYPDHLEGFRLQVYAELDWQTLRLGSRACLALFCGNNENHWLVHDGQPQAGGLIVYNRMAPQAVRRNSPHVPWWPSSPYGGAHPNDGDTGDRHHWQDCMMHPDMDKRIAPEEYDRVESRFVSEYGYPGPCRMASIEQYFGGLPVDRAGEVWALHNNTFEKHTVAAGIGRHYTDPQDLPLARYLFYASLVQALMLGYSLDAILLKPECHGALFWMYNDCWGETGWTVIDYYLRRKPCYYAVKRAFAPRRLVLREEAGQAILTAHNERPNAVAVDIAYGYVSFDGKTRAETTVRVELPAHSRSVALRFEACGRDDRLGVWFARAEGFEGAILRRLPFRALCVPKAAPAVSGVSDDGDDLLFTVSAEVFAHAVHFGFGDDTRLSDEYFDLLPGESRRIRAFGMAGKQARAAACPPANA